MRRLVLITAAVAAAIAGAFAAEPAFGTFTDTRDGQTYKTVKIGKQTWMAQNLNYEPQTGKSWCYENDTSYCNKYGRLYDWNTARTVCPIGYHLPSREEWDSLGRAMGGRGLPDAGYLDAVPKDAIWGAIWHDTGKKLKSKSGWRWNHFDSVSGGGTDNYGFSALPGGERYDGRFNHAGNKGAWWTATACRKDYAYIRDLDFRSTFWYDSYTERSSGLSVRCVADTP